MSRVHLTQAQSSQPCHVVLAPTLLPVPGAEAAEHIPFSPRVLASKTRASASSGETTRYLDHKAQKRHQRIIRAGQKDASVLNTEQDSLPLDPHPLLTYKNHF